MKRFLFFLIGALYALAPSHINAQAAVSCGDHVNGSVSGIPSDSCGIAGSFAGICSASATAFFIRPDGGTGYLIAGSAASYSVGGKTYHRWPRSGDGKPVASRNYIIPANLVGTAGAPTWADLNFAGVSPIHLKQFLGKDKRHIYECATGTTAPFNRCWGTFSLEDKYAPTVTCAAGITVECADTAPHLVTSITSTTLLRRPVATDNCGFKDSTLSVLNLASNNCNGLILRTWTYTDCGDNVVSCTDTIYVEKINRQRVMCPEPIVEIECNTTQTPAGIAAYYRAKIIADSVALIKAVRTVTNADSVRITKLADTTSVKYGYPWFKGPNVDTLKGFFDPLLSTTNTCGYMVSYTDVTIIDQCCVKKKARTWLIVDWCNNIVINNCTPQLIYIKDLVKPTVTAPAGDVVVNTNPWTCTATVTLPVGTGTDACDPNPTEITYMRSTGEILGSTKVLECGTYEVGIYAVDCCGLVSDTIYRTLKVVDRTPPFASAKRDILVSLTYNDGAPSPSGAASPGNASAKLLAGQVDNGSFDNCGRPVKLEIRRTKSYTSSTSPVCFNNTGINGWQNNFTFSGALSTDPCTGTTERTYRTTLTCDGHPIYAVYNCNGAFLRSYILDDIPGAVSYPVPTSCSPSLSTISSAWGSPISTTNAGTPLYSACDNDEGKFVKFCCTDLDREEVDANGDGVVNGLDKGWIEVQLRVWDDANKDGLYRCADDNYNDTWAFVKVECKLPPVITPPADATVTCDWPLTKSVGVWTKATSAGQFENVGFPTGYGVCGTLELTDFEWRDTENVGKCGDGTIKREWRASYWGFTMTVSQTITVSKSQGWAFYNDWPDARCAAYWHINTPKSIKTPNGQTGTKDQNVNFAKEVKEVGCGGPTAADIDECEPLYKQGSCDVIGLSTSTETFQFENGECRKWVVDYHYYNWCDHAEVTYRKIFVYNDKTAPVIAKQDTCIASGTGVAGTNLVNVGNVDRQTCATLPTISKIGTDPGCDDSNVVWIKWIVMVDEYNDGTTDYAYSSFIFPSTFANGSTNPAYADWSQTISVDGRNVQAKYLAPTASGAPATITFRNVIGGPWSDHKVTWKAFDGCHNEVKVDDIIEIRDKKAPTPYCVPLSTALMQGTDKMVEIWARDFDKGGFDNCEANQYLDFTFDGWIKSLGSKYPSTASASRRGLYHAAFPHYFDANGYVEESDYPAQESTAARRAARTRYLNGELQLWVPNTRLDAELGGTSAKVFRDNSIGVNSVRIDVTDDHDNSDWCMTELKIICNGAGCPTQAGSRIAGTVSTESNQTVNNVTVTIDANMAEYPVSVTTPTNGAFEKNVPNGVDYEVTASKAGDFLNGVSTLDLVMIQRHILGVQALATPYKLIAADVNNDGKVSASDLTELRKLILGIYNELPNNSSWRFPVSSQTMNSNNPFPYLEKIMISSIEKDMMDQNFVAVKVGDVNGNVSVNVSNPAVESRSNNTVAMAVAEQNIAAGDVVEIPVTAADFNDVAGFQYTMNLKGASFVGINGGAIEISDNNIGVIAKDVITMSYANDKAVTVSNDEVLFTIVVKADRAVKVSEMLSIGSAVTPAEAYNSDLKVGKVSLDVRTAPVTAIELMQNEPNPFKGQTTVNFMMPEAAAATLSVYDVTGKVVSVRNINANKGLNSEVFTREQLGASGVMYYTLKSGDFTATKKMIIIE